MMNIQDLQNELNASDNIIELFSQYGGEVYICDAITEQADSNVDIEYIDSCYPPRFKTTREILKGGKQ